MVSQAILIKLFLIIKQLLLKVIYWWKMPLVLILLYQLRQRDILMKNNLFDAYPRAVEPGKQHCNDPVIGYYHIGCYSLQYNVIYDIQHSYENCIRFCGETKHKPYAAYNKCHRTCYCVSTKTLQPAKSRDSRAQWITFKSATTCHWHPNCGRKRSSSFHVDVYRTMYCTDRMENARTIDGTCNDLSNSAMGSRLYRFGRNVPLNWTAEDKHMLEPNPRTISKEVLVRKQFIPVKQLNLLAAGWIQFMIHDWFDHGPPDTKNKIHVPLERHDPLYTPQQPSMGVARTKPNNCKTDKADPATFQNDVTHWWDLSQLYGSDLETNSRVRTHKDGKLELDDDGLLPVEKTGEKKGIDITGFNNNWWVGLALLHNIFTREHNSLCDMLRDKYPLMDDDELFDKARLINSAVMIKIHTIEWTPAILNFKPLRIGVRVNWGLDPGKEVWEWLAQYNITENPGIKPLVGQPKKLHGVPFSLTEEFVSVYRMHPLLPDYLEIKSVQGKECSGYSLPNYSFANARKVFENEDLADIIYTFGVESPGALTLNNYPKFLTNLKLPSHQQNGEKVDLATIDILRDRERGVPRYNKFRALMNLRPVESFEKLTPNTEHVAALKKLYGNDINKLDLVIGCLAEEPRPPGFGFGETAFNLFVFVASRRLETDRFMTNDFKEDIYTKEGMQWIKQRNMTAIMLDAYTDEFPQLPKILKDVENAFFPWVKA